MASWLCWWTLGAKSRLELSLHSTVTVVLTVDENYLSESHVSAGLWYSIFTTKYMYARISSQINISYSIRECLRVSLCHSIAGVKYFCSILFQNAFSFKEPFQYYVDSLVHFHKYVEVLTLQNTSLSAGVIYAFPRQWL